MNCITVERARILVVADNASGRNALSLCLRQAGHEVCEAASGQECLRSVADNQVELIVLAAKLPDVSGIEVCRQLKNAPETAAIPIILVSTPDAAAAHDTAEEENVAEGYLVSPFELRELLAQANSFLRARRAEDRLRQDADIQKRAEKALQKSQSRLTTALEIAQLGVWEYDIRTAVTHFDERCRDVLGLPDDHAVPNDQVFALVHPEDRLRVQDQVRVALEPGGTGLYETEYRIIRPDGGQRWVAVRGRAIQSDRQITHFVGTLMDITERKQFEGKLERLVAERTARLQELVGELEHFSYTITHDMRAPLRSMRGFAELVHELCSACQHPEQKALLRRIIAAADRMDLLITDALSYNKAVRQELPLGPVDVAALLRGMLDSYPEFQSSKAHIQFPGEIPLVLGNQAGLTQCFSNLLGNAVKFIEPGKIPEVRIRAELACAQPPATPLPTAASGPATITYPPATDRVRIWVEDNGIGISDTMRRRIFNMFARGSNDYEGTGIGLALVRKVVDRMGGRVGVESEPGQGSRFWVELLIADSRQPVPSVFPSPPPDPRTIL